MDRPGKPTKSEWVLLGITAAVLCLVLGLFQQDQAAAEPGLTVRTQTEVPAEALTPDLSPIDINTAGAEELDQLPGIGEVLAERIIAYREAHGPFASAEDLLAVSGIGEAKLAELEGWITVGRTPESGGDNESEGVSNGEDLSGGR